MQQSIIAPTINRLKKIVKKLGIAGRWHKLGTRHQYRTHDGAMLIWWSASESITFDGPSDKAVRLQATIAKALGLAWKANRACVSSRIEALESCDVCGTDLAPILKLELRGVGCVFVCCYCVGDRRNVDNNLKRLIERTKEQAARAQHLIGRLKLPSTREFDLLVEKSVAMTLSGYEEGITCDSGLDGKSSDIRPERFKMLH